MEGNTEKSITDIAARTLSVLLHPLFMPVYALAVIFSSSTPFGYLPVTVRRILFLIVVVNNVFLPVSLFPFLRHINFISWTLKERKERTVPLLISTILYATTSYIVLRFPIPVFLKAFVISVFILSLVITGINLKWKISLHSAGAGAFVAIVLQLFIRMYSPPAWFIIVAVIAAGAILSSRLHLRLHSPGQVWSGFFTGFVVLTGSMSFIQHLV